MMTHKNRYQSACLPAFSLVEVALAVAVIGVSLLAVVGLLPSLLETERDSAFRSMVPKLRAQALAELHAKPYPTTLPHTEELLFTESGEVTTEPAKAVYKCDLSLAVPPASASAATGGIPKLKTDFCMVRLTCSLTSEPGGTPVEFHESLAKER
jgi:Tfp pilus assembly protein PilV